MNYSEFEEKILKRHERKLAKIRNSWGVKDAFRYNRKNKWPDIGQPIEECTYYSIIRKVNDLLAEEIASGETVLFPCGMGKLELRKREVGVVFKDDKLEVSYPVDWKSTLKLWYEDDEERAKKTLVRFHQPYVYFVKYLNKGANYANKTFYQFALNRDIKRKMREYIDKGKVDTPW